VGPSTEIIGAEIVNKKVYFFSHLDKNYSNIGK
jgi:hypothetical protein